MVTSKKQTNIGRVVLLRDLITIILLTLSIPAHAQFGNLLNNLKGAADAIQKSVQDGQPSKDGNTPTASGGTSGVADAEEYCKRFTNSPSVIALSQAMDSVGNPNLVIRYSNQHTYLDNANGDLEKWVASKLASLPSRDTRKGKDVDPVILNSMIKAVNSCVPKSKFSLVGASKRSDTSNDIYYGIQTTISLENGPGRIARFDKNPREASLMAFFFDGAEEEIKKVSPNPTASFDTAANKIKQEQKSLADAKAAEAEKEARIRKQNAEIDAFNASPDGQLLSSYRSFQIVQLCHDIRKGLAVQFVTANEMSDFKSKMKQIENKLKGSVKDKNTDRIWKLAEERNRDFGSFQIDGNKVKGVDLIATITNNNKSNWIAAKNDCDAMTQNFRQMVTEVLGNEPMKKSF